ncbi:hypothetical protein [Lactobacillus fuchuensis]|uniref:Uncharacterized protein n=1 Tax=Latilactobacillus fuchuensis DSM 14340 = JCM 11249 TaxID=1423747 RepID=A0A0R1S346_9LACO|nr:hypothetical protein FC69_GL001468 [Latilactobacillus fuchuensis DSM 14340 = JCM 11249]
MDIYLKQAILQVVDRDVGSPVFSQQTLDLTSDITRDYLTNKVKKLSSAQSKTGIIKEEASLLQLITLLETDFINGEFYNEVSHR